jgi:hypothetical protein
MRSAILAVIVGAGTLAAGCASLREQVMPAQVPPPPLRLVSAGSLELPRGCEVRDGVVYRTRFVVQGDGRVAEIRPEPAPACVRAGLAEWLNGFQYAPPGEAVSATTHRIPFGSVGPLEKLS